MDQEKSRTAICFLGTPVFKIIIIIIIIIIIMIIIIILFWGVGVAKIVVYKCSLKPPRNFHVIRLNGKQP